MKYQDTLVIVALSGGVDSAVALHLLKKQYHNVVAISHRHWPESRCCSTASFDACRRQCQDLGVDYHIINGIAEFTEDIIEPFIRDYRNGITPNPCVYCNPINRFGYTIEKFLNSLGNPGPERYKIATGHYARIITEKGRYWLERGIDKTKDQSYMLYRLSQKQLGRCLFPLGDLNKTEVKKIAEDWKLKSIQSSESQDICFVDKNYRDFIIQYTGKEERPGLMVDKNGKELGTHTGISNYNRGQRKGLGLGGGPWYVLEIDPHSRNVVLGSKDDLLVRELAISDCIWNLDEVPDQFNCEVQIRYHGQVYKCSVSRISEDLYRIKLNIPSLEVSPGQSAVLYSENTVWGGGIIQRDLFPIENA
jgi:tRNA-specific 2-thiouridylase